MASPQSSLIGDMLRAAEANAAALAAQASTNAQQASATYELAATYAPLAPPPVAHEAALMVQELLAAMRAARGAARGCRRYHTAAAETLRNYWAGEGLTAGASADTRPPTPDHPFFDEGSPVEKESVAAESYDSAQDDRMLFDLSSPEFIEEEAEYVGVFKIDKQVPVPHQPFHPPPQALLDSLDKGTGKQAGKAKRQRRGSPGGSGSGGASGSGSGGAPGSGSGGPSGSGSGAAIAA